VGYRILVGEAENKAESRFDGLRCCCLLYGFIVDTVSDINHLIGFQIIFVKNLVMLKAKLITNHSKASSTPACRVKTKSL
jgi:hypothetical protein